MQNEFEIKFLDIDEDKIREKLQSLGAKLVQEKKLMRRQTLDFAKGTFPDDERKWARVRDEGDKITMTIKHIIDKSRIDGTKEVETIVDDFESACNLFVESGLTKTSYQENYREEWKLEKTMITIDTWPGLEPFVEIESPAKEEAEEISQKLGFKLEDGLFGSIDMIYEKILKVDPSKVNSATKLTFDSYKEVLS